MDARGPATAKWRMGLHNPGGETMRDINDVEQRLCNYIRNSSEARAVLCRLHDMDIEGIDMQMALMEVLELKTPVDLLERELSAVEMVERLRDFNFGKYHPELLAEIHLDESVIPETVPRLLTEVTIKNRGEIWRIHKNDPDPFPSNPHAENYASGLKLDLSTGMLFRKRAQLGSISEKHLRLIRHKAKRKGVELPPHQKCRCAKE